MTLLTRRAAILAIFAAVLVISVSIVARVLLDTNGTSKLRIATSKNLWCTLTLVALGEHLFEDEKIKPVVSYQAAGRLNMDALISGSADLANVVEVNVANQAIAGNDDLSILGSIVHATDYGVVVHSNIGVDRPDQLSGKKIAFAPGTGAETFLYAFLKRNHMSLSDVELLRVPPSGLVEQFVNGGVDAGVSWEPFVSTMVRRTDGKAQIFRDPDAYVGLMNIAVRRSWKERNPDLAERVIGVYLTAEDFVRKHPAEAQAIVADETGIPLKDVEQMWGRFDYTVTTDSKDDIALTNNVIKTLEEVNYQGAGKPAIDDVTDYYR